MKTLIICLLIISLALPFSLCGCAKNDLVTLTTDGDLAAMLDSVSDGGTIRVEGKYTVPKNFVWENHGKTVTITGDTLDFSALTDVVLGDGVTFENIKLQFAKESTIYANGNPLTIAETASVSGEPTVYGGGKFTTVESTNVTLLSGTYTDIYGGSMVGNVRGDVNLNVGGKVNANLKSLSHKHTYCVYGGCYNGKVTGKVTLNFGESARANYIYGGSTGKNSNVEGGIEVSFTGGNATSLYGGSRDALHTCNIKLTMSGGTLEQIFGGSEHATFGGNIELNILGGTITRRIYGGCYNEVSAGGVWSSANYVYGNICLTLSGDANITFSTGSADRAIYAHSRQSTLSNKENSQIRFADALGFVKYKNKLGAQDSIMRSIMSGVSAADEIIETIG